MILFSAAPVLKMTGQFYITLTAIAISILGGIMMYFGIQLHQKQTDLQARKLMLASVLYITGVQMIYVIDKFLH